MPLLPQFKKIPAVIVTLRCYALYDRRRWILVPVTGLGLVVLGAFAVCISLYRFNSLAKVFLKVGDDEFRRGLP